MNAIHVELKKFCEVIKIKTTNQFFNKREIISQFFAININCKLI